MNSGSILDLFTIGIGPSSSHTVGPMRAARRFATELIRLGVARVARIRITLYGSLALTGKGHGTDRALLLGLAGHTPEEVPIDDIDGIVAGIRGARAVALSDGSRLAFNEADDVLFRPDEVLPRHSNGLTCEAFDTAGQRLLARIYYSIGGGALLEGGDGVEPANPAGPPGLRFVIRSGDQMLRAAQDSGLSVSQMTLENERVWRPETETRAALLRIWQVMQECVDRGCHKNFVITNKKQY